MQSSASREKKILVVDDDPDILDFLHDLLELEGYAVSVSAKGDYLEQLHNGGLPELILLDVFLSGRDGREIVKSLKNQQETRQIPVIMFSAHPSSEETARAAGADDFLAKPFAPDELLAMVHAFLFLHRPGEQCSRRGLPPGCGRLPHRFPSSTRRRVGQLEEVQGVLTKDGVVPVIVRLANALPCKSAQLREERTKRSG